MKAVLESQTHVLDYRLSQTRCNRDYEDEGLTPVADEKLVTRCTSLELKPAITLFSKAVMRSNYIRNRMRARLKMALGLVVARKAYVDDNKQLCFGDLTSSNIDDFLLKGTSVRFPCCFVGSIS